MILQRERLTEDADKLLRRLFPICRSLTGDGVRESFAVLQETAKFAIDEIPSGTACYDWTVPDEWNITDAYVATEGGQRVVDFRENNLHVVGYSVPVDAVMSFDELLPRLHTLPHLPDAIPYRTSYYRRDWGFCLSQRQLDGMDRRARYHVRIESRLHPGAMLLGERVIGGDDGEEFLISCYCCHPSVANDSLSGTVLWALLLRELEARSLRHRYRLVILPETIGAIAYLWKHEPEMKALAGGFVLTTVAGPGPFGYKASFLDDSRVDKSVRLAFRDLDRDFVPYPFDVLGSDESHYSSPHFRIPVGTICKDKYYEYPYYHTSLDNLDFVTADHLVSTLELYLEAIENLERDVSPRSLHPWAEPMLGKRGLYPHLGGQIRQSARQGDKLTVGADEECLTEDDVTTILWIMFMSDGSMSVMQIAERTGVSVSTVFRLVETLRGAGLLEVGG